MTAATASIDIVPRATSRVQPRIVAGALFAVAIVAISFVTAWPLYRSGSFALLAGVSALLAGAIAAVAWSRRWSGWITALVLAVTFFVVGVPLAVPARLSSPLEILQGVGEVGTGLVFGWKDLLTVDLPVGAYRNLLVPALVVFLVGTCALLLLAWRADAVAYGAVPVALVMMSFGLFFGRTVVSAPLVLGPLVLVAPVETISGAAGLLACVLWLAWRTHDERARALQRAADTSGVRMSRRLSPADRRRIALGAGMVAVSLVAAIAVIPFATRDADRTVLRSAVGPEIDLSREVSPLSQYRALFAAEDEVLFEVDVREGAPDRIRLATLDDYDGEVFRAGGGDSVSAGRFLRVPSALDAGDGEPIDVRVRIEALDGIWMPTTGHLAEIEFGGSRAASLSDGFYYSADAEAGVQIAGSGLRTGDTYRVRAVDDATALLTEIAAPRGVVSDVAAPESLQAWVEEHATGSDGAALADLVALLRERGYLSHGLVEDERSALWMEPLGDYTFQPSASGHSLARMQQMFTRLLDREVDPRAVASDNFVATIGDDEQFATAVALVARELGFPSRVVVGARLASDDPTLPTCTDGVCRTQDIAAWTEVQSAAGEWIPIDVTPQYEQSPSLDITEQRDPENVTEVRPDTVDRILPPDPAQEDTTGEEIPDQAGALDLAWLWQALRVAGIVLAILALAFGPFLAVVIAKSLRRRARRRADTAAVRIVGGWDEYADAAVDAGRETPRAATRAEVASAFATVQGARLAEVADRAAFGGPVGGLSDDDADEFWRIVDQERRELRSERGVWRGFAATVSLRSFFRASAPAKAARARTVERGRRRMPDPARPS